ncbi:hypothetical protein CDAR_521471 [Caerostris darwini]|uniref:Uncharacterized protein n=1 Tax=Caerostris darwini TaxID=1538125 RepID=A0AAV4UX00_9ARAC|nr:hypothetical protein CDAR_521471 [Caerostris darwini]
MRRTQNASLPYASPSMLFRMICNSVATDRELTLNSSSGLKKRQGVTSAPRDSRESSRCEKRVYIVEEIPINHKGSRNPTNFQNSICTTNFIKRTQKASPYASPSMLFRMICNTVATDLELTLNSSRGLKKRHGVRSAPRDSRESSRCEVSAFVNSQLLSQFSVRFNFLSGFPRNTLEN